MDDRPKESQYPKLEDHDCKNHKLSTNPEIVGDLLLQLDPKNSMGHDGIHPRTLKELVDVNINPLLMIFEPSWESKVVPAVWKVENVPIFKKDKKEDSQN
ncbi:RNA-directed DNA polymerase from mobile element jockey [Turdus rufiventris]|nr:RNA-directed DNA polymerase from mobile element jockey [Turdus rufiventris]